MELGDTITMKTEVGKSKGINRRRNEIKKKKIVM
jgi:hypothetical protein